MIAFTTTATEDIHHTAEDLGYTAVSPLLTDPDMVEAQEPGETVYTGFHITTENIQTFHRRRKHVRNQVDLLAAGSTDLAVNREAIDHSDVDILLVNPATKHEVFDHVLAKRAADTRTTVLFTLKPFIFTDTSKQRTFTLQTLRTYLRYTTHFDTPHLFTTQADTALQLRSHRSLEAIGRTVIDLPPHSQYQAWMQNLENLVKTRRDPDTVRPGITARGESE